MIMHAQLYWFVASQWCALAAQPAFFAACWLGAASAAWIGSLCIGQLFFIASETTTYQVNERVNA